MEKNEGRSLVAGGACFGKARGDRVRKTRECDDGESDRTELTPDLVGAVTSLCVIQRKKRMARQRRASLNVLAFSHVPPPPARVRLFPPFFLLIYLFIFKVNLEYKFLIFVFVCPEFPS